MFLDKKPFIFLWRPFYQLVFDGIIHPIVRRSWASVLLLPLPPHPPANSMAAHLQESKRILEAIGRLETALVQSKLEWSATVVEAIGRLETALVQSKQEWSATEKLLIALIQEPGAQFQPEPEPLYRAEGSKQVG